MRLFLTLLLSGLAAPLFSADPQKIPVDPPKPNYYPLTKGTKWEYRLMIDEVECGCLCEITEAECKDGKTKARMEAKFPNAVTIGEELSADASGVYRNAVLGAKLLQPLPIIKYPIKARDTWKDKLKLGSIEGDIAITIRDTKAKIEVSAGKFTALAIESAVEINGDRVVASIWYVDGIGIVKQETRAGSRLISMELKKFWPSK